MDGPSGRGEPLSGVGMDGLIAMRNRVIVQGVQLNYSVSKPLWYRTTDPSQKMTNFVDPILKIMWNRVDV